MWPGRNVYGKSSGESCNLRGWETGGSDAGGYQAVSLALWVGRCRAISPLVEKKKPSITGRCREGWAYGEPTDRRLCVPRLRKKRVPGGFVGFILWLELVLSILYCQAVFRISLSSDWSRLFTPSPYPQLHGNQSTPSKIFAVAWQPLHPMKKPSFCLLLHNKYIPSNKTINKINYKL